VSWRATGYEIGAHGWEHVPLDGPADLERELVDARAALAATLETEISTVAYPYGASPSQAAQELIERTFVRAVPVLRIEPRIAETDESSLPSRRPPSPSVPTTMNPKHPHPHVPVDTRIHLRSGTA
jgi:peptidoglycan/xylan/chitin deacetylase (PgdA/CDA1 family)